MLWNYVTPDFLVLLNLFLNLLYLFLNVIDKITGFELPPALIAPTATETFNGLKAMAKEIANKYRSNL